MSYGCDSSTPLSSRFDADVLRPDSAIFDELFDASSLIDQGNPLDRVDRQGVINLTNSLNDTLSGIDLSAYPVLKARLDQFPLTYVEVADFVVADSTDIDSIDAAIKNYNANDETETDESLQFVAVGPDDPETDFSRVEFVATDTTAASGAGDITAVDTSATYGDGIDSSLLIPVVLAAFLANFNFHLDVNIGASVSGGLCGQFGNIFNKLFGLFTLIKTTKDLLDDLKNDDEKDPTKKATSTSLVLSIKALNKSIGTIIKKLVKQIKKRIKAMIDFAVKLLAGLGRAAQKLYRMLKRLAQNILSFFSDLSIKGFILRIEGFIASTSSQFERLTVANVGLLMFRFCQFVDFLQSLLMGPIIALTSLITTVATESTIAKNSSLNSTKGAVDAGAVRVPVEDREQAKSTAILNTNAASKVSSETSITSTGAVIIPQVDYQTPREATPVEIFDVNTVSEDGIQGKFTFVDSIKTDTKQWEKIQQDVWIRLLRICELTGEQYVVTSAFRDKSHNRSVGGSANSVHMSGYAIDIRVNASHREDFFLAAQRAGFTGFGIYDSFIHLDCGSRRMWVAGHAGESESSYALSGAEKNKWVNAIPKHLRDEYRKNSGVPVEQLAAQNSLEVERAIAAEAATQRTKRVI